MCRMLILAGLIHVVFDHRDTSRQIFAENHNGVQPREVLGDEPFLECQVEGRDDSSREYRVAWVNSTSSAGVAEPMVACADWDKLMAALAIVGLGGMERCQSLVSREWYPTRMGSLILKKDSDSGSSSEGNKVTGITQLAH